jgi:hypothetical protein
MTATPNVKQPTPALETPAAWGHPAATAGKQTAQ